MVADVCRCVVVWLYRCVVSQDAALMQADRNSPGVAGLGRAL